MFLVQAVTRGVVAYIGIMCLGVAWLQLRGGIDTASLGAMFDTDVVLANVEGLKGSLLRSISDLL